MTLKDVLGWFYQHDKEHGVVTLSLGRLIWIDFARNASMLPVNRRRADDKAAAGERTALMSEVKPSPLSTCS